MRYEIRHRTAYAFGAPVFLEPHTVRLRPRADPAQSLDSFALTVAPAPAGLSDGIDLSGNAFSVVWFDGMASSLTIEAHTTVTTARTNPFDYLILPAGLDPLPWALHDRAAAPFLRYDITSTGDPVAAFATALAAETGSVVPFLTALNNALHRSMTVIIREEGDPNSAAETLATQIGSCRDLAVLFADACRAVGIPARFVSGYQEGDTTQPRRDLHAWAEAWIPGGGWRGYDPTLGLVVADRHIALAAAADSHEAAPITGSYRGSPPSVTMSVTLEITRV